MNKLSRVEYGDRFSRLANNMGTLRAQLCDRPEPDRFLVDRVTAVVKEDLVALGFIPAPEPEPEPAKSAKKPATKPADAA